MSTNHNRIRVADLEQNEPNKVLTTNEKGELEFSDVNNLKTEGYNALDYTAEGKVLDARQGKVLKDMIDIINIPQVSLINDLTTGGASEALTVEMGKTLENTKLTATIATDAETQITEAVTEDNKVISRSKLFNWWIWIKSQTQTISGLWTFSNKLILASGNTTSPALIIPNGTLTSALQNGAIERDSDGQLWETHNVVRSRLITSYDDLILIAFKQPSVIQINIAGNTSATATNISSNTVIEKIGSNSVVRLNALNEVYYTSPMSGTISPTVAKTEIF